MFVLIRTPYTEYSNKSHPLIQLWSQTLNSKFLIKFFKCVFVLRRQAGGQRYSDSLHKLPTISQDTVWALLVVVVVGYSVTGDPGGRLLFNMSNMLALPSY